MKPLDATQKDRLIVSSILEEDLPQLFKSLSVEFAANIVYMQGTAQKISTDFDSLRKYYRSEVKNILSPEDWKPLQEFFDTFSDKILLADNKDTIIYATTFAYRFLYNLFFMGANSMKDKLKSIEDNHSFFNPKTISLLKSFTVGGDDDEVQKSFIVMSETFYYMAQVKIDPDEYREALTHGITGCFLLEEHNLKKINLLSSAIELQDVVALV